MKSIRSCMSELMNEMGIDAAKFSRIADNNEHYVLAVKSIWKDANAHKLILSHTNAFYVMVDEKPHKGFPKDKDYVICEVCVDDPLVRSEIDTHRELLSFALRTNGLAFEELRIVSARGNMRKRHPFS